MQWTFLKSSLGNCPINYFIENNPSAEFMFIEKADRLYDNYQSEIIYYSTLEELHQTSLPSESVDSPCLLLLNNQQVQLKKENILFNSFSNIAVFENEENFHITISSLNTMLAEERFYEKKHRELIDHMVKNHPLTSLANEIALMYNHYIDILDSSMNILAYSDVIAPPNTRLLEDRELRFVKPDVVSYLLMKGSLDNAQTNHIPVLVKDAPRSIYAYTMPISAGINLQHGYLCVFVDKDETFSPVTLHYIAKTAQFLAIVLQRINSFHLNKTTYFSHILKEIIEGMPSLSLSYEKQMAAFNYTLKKWKYFAILDINTLSASEDVTLLASTLHKLITNSIYTLYDNYIVYLASADTSYFQSGYTLATNYINTNNLYLGLSDPFENIADAPTYFSQALLTLELNNRSGRLKHLCRYEDFRLYDIVSHLGREKSAKYFLYQPLMHLINCPDRDDPEHILPDTLRQYLHNNQSVKATCEALHIHRNTLYYRLEKIQALMHADFTDPEVLTQILLTFYLLDYMQMSYRPKD